MNNSQSWLSWFLRGLIILLFLILTAKLFEVQVIKGNYYQALSQENRIRHVSIPAPRGKILAKNGEELATNVEIKKRIKLTDTGFQISDDLTGAKPEEMVTDYKRVYPMGDKFSHPVGYLTKVGADEAGKINPGCPEKGPRPIDAFIGKTGLEESYDCLLTGTPGEELIEVNTKGLEVRVLGRRAPIPGKNLITTIDYGLQNTVAMEMNGKKGAAIVMDAKGQILAFYSYPSYDPNIFINQDSQKISELLKDPDLPFFNRVIGGTFHPGSVFKPLVAVSALESGVIDKNFYYNDTGVIKVNDYSYSNWYFTQYGRTEGSINLIKAIARSTDTFFYTIGQMTGPDNIAKWAKNFGLDKPTGIDISGEKSGLIPTPDWKKKTIGESWFLGNTYHMSIGQGDVNLTPIGVNNYISVIASDGELCIPHFLAKESAISSSQFSIFNCKSLQVEHKNLDLVKSGMEAACSQGGTAYTFFDFPNIHKGVQVACKTGTAEVGTNGTSHAWFTMFAPSENPQIISTVLVEKGGEGSSVAGPIARKIADFYFQNK